MTTRLARLSPHHVRLLRRAFKVALAAVLATVVAELFHLRFPWFATLAAIVTMELTLRTSLRAGRDGIVGATVGATTGLALTLIGKDQAWAVGVAVLLNLLVLSWLGYAAAGRQAAFVASVIVLVPATSIHPVDFAWVRFVETVIGVVSALVVNAVVFPPRAYRQVRRSLADAYDGLAGLYRHVMTTAATGVRNADDIVGARREFRTAMRAVDDFWEEAVAESPSDEVLDTGWRRITRRIWEQCTAMDDATMEPAANEQLAPVHHELAALANRTAEALDQVALAFRNNTPLPETHDLEPLRMAVIHRVEDLSDTQTHFAATLQALTFVNGVVTIAARLIDLSEPGGTHDVQ